MRQVGTRVESPLSLLPSSDGIASGAAFNACIAQLAGGSTFVPKGVYRFKSHEQAAEMSARWLAEGMAQLALARRHHG